MSNNGYLDNPTFRGMRGSLLRTFDKIWIVNLHGNANEKEKAPDGSKDENIFDIMPGVALFIGIKKTRNPSWARVFYTDVWGDREKKLSSLDKGGLVFNEINLDPKMAYFIPFGGDDKSAYESGVNIAELFSTSVTGIITGNDKVAIAPTRNELVRRLNTVRNSTNDKTIIEMWGKFTAGQNADKIRADVVMGEGSITPIAFRPFDNRWTYYSGNSCSWIFRPREKNTMGHLLAEPTTPIGQNIGLVFCKTSRTFFPPFVSKNIIAHRLFSAMCEITYIAPLYLCSGNGLIDRIWTENIDSDSYQKLTQYLSVKPSPIEVFDYVYGVLHDPVYSEKYEQYLCRDFPRVPIINNESIKDDPNAFFVSEEMFKEYVAAGARLREIHLMDTKIAAEITLEPNTPENMEIGAIKYKDQVLQINRHKRIYGIPKDVWEYQIGGHQVLDKWFKEHKGETLSIESFTHIENMVGALSETIRLREHLKGLHE